MKKAQYTLSVEYDDGNSLHQAPLTQARAYQILRAYKDKGWIRQPALGSLADHRQSGPLHITRWKLSTGWQETEG